jgi:hypothetical protein
VDEATGFDGAATGGEERAANASKLAVIGRQDNLVIGSAAHETQAPLTVTRFAETSEISRVFSKVPETVDGGSATRYRCADS